MYLEGEEPTRRAAHARHPPRDDRQQAQPGAVRLARSRTRACSPCSTRSSTTCRRRSTSTPIEGHKPSATRTRSIARKPSEDEPFSALAFKIMSDPHLGKLTYVRVYSGTLDGRHPGAELAPRTARSGSARSTRCTRTSVRRSTASGAGDIVAVMGLKDTTTGDTLCDPTNADHPRVDELPGPGHPRRDRAEDQGRPGEAGHRDPAARRGGPDLPGPHRRGDRPDDHRRHGRAAPRHPRRPHAARVQGRGQRRQAAGGLPRDDRARPSRRSTTRTRSRPVAPASTRASSSTSSRPAARATAATSSSTRSPVAASRGSTSPRSTPAARRPWSSASSPATRWSTSR